MNFPDTPEHWAICSGEFLAAMALFGEPKPKAEPVKAKKKPGGKRK
jgi:hypothetical protein